MLNQHQLGTILIMAACAFGIVILAHNHEKVLSALSGWWNQQRQQAAQREQQRSVKTAPLLTINLPGKAADYDANYDELEEEEEEASQSGGKPHSQGAEGDIPAPFLQAAEELQQDSEGQNPHLDLTYSDLFNILKQVSWTRTEMIILLSTLRFVNATGEEQLLNKSGIAPCVGMRAADASVIIDTARDQRILVRTHPQRQQYRLLRPTDPAAADH